jgi:hemerythrin
MEIGSESSFGAFDVLIQGGEDYLFQRAFKCLQNFFPTVKAGQIRMLLNSPAVKYNAGTIIHRSGEDTNHLDMILTGTVTYIEAASKIRNHLSFGSFIGNNNLFREQEALEGTYRALSHASVIRFPINLFQAFLVNNDVKNHTEMILDKIGFLRNTWLFGGQTTFMTLRAIAHVCELVSFSANVDIPVKSDLTQLWLVVKGDVRLINKRGDLLEVIRAGGFFGEHLYLTSSDVSWRFKTDGPVDLYCLQYEKLLEIPIAHWKMLEIFEKRSNIAPVPLPE